MSHEAPCKVYVPSKPLLVFCWSMFHRPRLDTRLSSEAKRETNEDARLSTGEYGALCAPKGAAACHAISGPAWTNERRNAQHLKFITLSMGEGIWEIISHKSLVCKG